MQKNSLSFNVVSMFKNIKVDNPSQIRVILAKHLDTKKTRIF